MFIKQKTAYEMRISDWSSDVCSSDLPCPMPLIAKAKRHDGMGSALHSRAPRKLAGRWQLPPHPFYRTQPVKSAAYNERPGPRVAGGGSCHRGNTKGTRPFVPEA